MCEPPIFQYAHDDLSLSRLQANPLTLPRRRVAKANIYYLNTMAPLRGVHVPQSSQGEGGRDDSLESTILGYARVLYVFNCPI